MMPTVPVDVLIGSFSIIGVLTGYIWNAQSKRIASIEQTQGMRPCTSICGHIESIRTDINWIKKILEQKKW